MCIRDRHNQGHHFLVDYGDQGKYPNFTKTIFGHAIYTKLDLMQFHLKLILKQNLGSDE